MCLFLHNGFDYGILEIFYTSFLVETPFNQYMPFLHRLMCTRVINLFAQVSAFNCDTQKQAKIKVASASMGNNTMSYF